ncbi:hypothetical protein PMAC_000202 [Pneumocystis sp. 'macacae']|nr:hypothetical protein PMAC_000202 [Pneumocystis sp. 'macacae']
MNEFDLSKQKKGFYRTYGKNRLHYGIFGNFRIWNDIENSPNLKKKNKSTDTSKENESPSSPFSKMKISKDCIGSIVKKASFLYRISVKQDQENSPLNKLEKSLQNQGNILHTLVSVDKENHLKPVESTGTNLLENIILNKTESLLKNEIKKKQSIIESLLSFSSQSKIFKFSDYISSLLSTYTISKLGEASFSEVYLIKDKSNEEIVLKIIPFGKEGQENPQEILHEIRVTVKMSLINGFVKSKGFVIVKGAYPKYLIHLWDKYHKDFKSENPRPDFYTEDQHFCILLLEKGGKDLEHANIKSWKQVNKIFWHIVKVLSEGEKKYEFEHRDLHWGNILVNEISDSSEDALSQLSLYNTSFQQPCIIIIDYTLSRLKCSDHIGELTWNNLEDQEIFEGYDKLIHCKGLLRPPTRLSKRTNSVNCADIEIERMFYEKAESVWKTINPKKKQFTGESLLEFNSAEDVLLWGIKEGLA